MSYLIDTNVIAELRKGDRADPALRSWFATVADEEIFLSVLTIGEIRRGIEAIRRHDSEAAAALDGWLSRVHRAHRDRILQVSRAVTEEWGRINVPDPLPVVDGLLAATAKVTGLTLATRNVGALKRAGVELVDPFAG